MVGKKVIQAFGVLLAVASAVPIILAYVAPTVLSATDFEGSFLISYSVMRFVPLTIALLSVCVIFLRWSSLAKVKGEPSAVLHALAHRFRASGFMVSEEPRHIVVRINSNAAVKVRAVRVSDGVDVRFAADATPGGWSIMIIFLLLFVFTAPITVLYAFLICAAVIEFARTELLSRLTGLPLSGMPEGYPDTRAMLIDSLSESRRIAVEARESAVSSKEDWILAIFLVGFVIFLVVLVMGVAWLPAFGGLPSYVVPLAVSISVGAAFIVLGMHLLRRRTRPLIRDLATWSSRLSEALARETSLAAPSDPQPSSFEILVEAWKQVPLWVSVRRKAATYREPGDWMIIVGCVAMSVTLFISAAISYFVAGLPVTAVFALSGIAFILPARFFYVRWKRQTDDEERRLRSFFKTKLERLMSDLEREIGMS